MILEKCKGNSKKDLVFFNRHEHYINLNATIRDTILPKEYVFLDYDGKNKLTLIPTDNEDGYKVTIKSTGGEVIGYCAQKKNINLPLNKRVYGKIEDNGTISFDLSKQ